MVYIMSAEWKRHFVMVAEGLTLISFMATVLLWSILAEAMLGVN